MAKVNVKGTIVANDEKWIYDWFGIQATSPADVEASINADNEEILIEINSPGGDVFAGSEIYTMLRSVDRKKKCNIVGLAASAASVIAMACETYMSPTAQLMIHNVSTVCAGDYNSMDHMSDILKNANKSIASAYVNKTGKSEEEILALMNKETWFTAEEAKKLGLVDGVMFENTQLVANFGNIIPREIITKMQNEKNQQNINKKINIENKLKELNELEL